MEEVVLLEVQVLDRIERRRRTVDSARATARLSWTTGLVVKARSWSYSWRIWRQSVSAGVGASLWTALIAAWI